MCTTLSHSLCCYSSLSSELNVPGCVQFSLTRTDHGRLGPCCLVRVCWCLLEHMPLSGKGAGRDRSPPLWWVSDQSHEHAKFPLVYEDVHFSLCAHLKDYLSL